MVADDRALAELERTGIVDLKNNDTLVIQATSSARSATRSPRTRLGRTGVARGAHVEVEALCSGATSADQLFADFRLEAAV